MNPPDAERYRRAVMNQRGPIRVGLARRLHRILEEQRIMANEQAQQAANAPQGQQADPDALAAELHAKVQHATTGGSGAPAGAQAAPISWGAVIPTPAELTELQGLSKEAMAFLFKYAMARVGMVFGG